MSVELKNGITAYLESSNAKMQAVLEESAREIAETAKLLAPKDSGDLGESYNVIQTGESSFQIGSPLDYSVFQEFGTTKMQAQPHLTPAFEAKRAGIRKKIADAYK